MINTKTVEDIVNAYIENNHNRIIDILEKEIHISKTSGKYNVARRLRNLVNRIPNKGNLSSQSDAPTNRNGILLKQDNALYERINSNILLEEVILDDSQRKVISSFLKEWEDYNKLIKYNIAPTNKLLFYGPPGTGKTKLAFAIANKLGFPLILVRLDELISSYLGKTGKNIREIFDIARQGDVVILLDEIDTIAKHRDDDKELGELKRVVTVLLQNIDNFPNNSIIIGATNNEKLLDKAVWRRFPLKLEFNNPDELNRALMFELYLNSFPNSIDFNLLAKLTNNFNGSAIYDVSQAIKKQAILSNLKKVSNIDAIKFLLTSTSIIGNEFKIPKKQLYEMCQILKDNGFVIKDVEKITGIPYTTLRDNLI